MFQGFRAYTGCQGLFIDLRVVVAYFRLINASCGRRTCSLLEA